MIYFPVVVFSSPEPKAQVSFSHHLASVVILIFFTRITGPKWTKLWCDND